MKQSERQEALTPHIKKAWKQCVQALDEACREATPAALDSYRAARARCEELDLLYQDAGSTWDGEE